MADFVKRKNNEGDRILVYGWIIIVSLKSVIGQVLLWM